MSIGDRFDDPATPLFTVGQVAAMLDVQPAFLRRLDEQDMVQPARSGGNQRRYSRRQVEHVGQIRTLMDDGMTLPAIRLVLRLQARVAELEAEVALLRAPPVTTGNGPEGLRRAAAGPPPPASRRRPGRPAGAAGPS